MANKRLSELPAATALTGTETVPVVQANETRRTTVADIMGLASAWIAPTLQNGFINYGTPFNPAGYRSIGTRVELRGVLKASGAPNQPVLFTLPAGYVPANAHIRLTAGAFGAGDVPARIDIKPTGAVQLVTPTSGATVDYLVLDGIAFER